MAQISSRVEVTTGSETLQQMLHEPSTSERPPQAQTVVTLRLAPRLKKKVSWREDTVDNEHMQKKKSKICCIFHKDDDDDSDDGDDKGKGKEEDHHPDCDHAQDDGAGANGHAVSSASS